MLGQLFTIARNTFVESIRQPIFFILVMASGLLQAVNTMLSAYSMGYTEETEVFGDNKLLLDIGLATVMVCSTLLAAFVSTSVLSREIENKTALTVVSKPISRPVFVVGKYLGVSAAVTLAVATMLLFLLFAIRHGVMSTARDHLDGPVLVFTTLAVIGAVGVASWTNFFYGWVFPSVATALLLPLLAVGYVVTISISKEWAWQPPATDFKPQILLACLCVVLAMAVLSAIAIAASTRLGQVMTIFVCSGVFILGLLSNHLLGRFAFDNTQVAVVAAVELDDPEPGALRRAGATARVTLEGPPRDDFAVGDSFFYGPNPKGVRLAVPAHAPFEGDPADGALIRTPGVPPALVVLEIDEETSGYTLVNVGGLPVARPPEEGDFVFAGPTSHNPAAIAAWSVVPNIQSFWLVDAITQGHDIPARYLWLLLAYTGAQVTGAVALAVLLFQRRDMG